MKCPYCGNIDTRVIDSRPADDGTTIRRRRSCDACNKRFTTYEKVETIPLIVIKKDNNREQYDRTKLEGGVLRACYKRPVAAADRRSGGFRSRIGDYRYSGNDRLDRDSDFQPGRERNSEQPDR